jgi:2-dehydropantoate 2-reductase
MGAVTIAIANVPVSDAPRYIIVGAGAIGGTLGGVLARAGIPVVLIARGNHAKALATGGIVLRTPDETCRVPVETASSPHDVHLTPRDVLVFATKSQQLDAALQEWTDVPVRDGDREIGTAGETLPVLTALNGIAAEEKALRYFRRVFGVCVWMPALHLTPGEVIVRSWPVAGQFHVARWPASLHTGDDDELLARVAATWTPAGVRVQLPPDVAPWKYNKLLSNLANAVGALAGSDGETAELQAAAQREGEAVLRHAGIDFVPFAVSGAARADGPTPRPVPGAGAAMTNSTWQSLNRNTGNAETDFLNGEIVRIAHRHGIAAPVNAGLATLMRKAVREGAGAGAYSAAALASALGLTVGAGADPDRSV